jgi:tetratricopeptide (TPR) repeat protein
MNIEAINRWFYDDKTAKGVSFDGFLPQACKTPLGNMPLGNTPEFELIHTPEKMADFQNNDWYRKNWKLGDTLLTFSPLQPDKHVLVDDYRKEMAKILSCSCDSECCKHDASCGAWPTRRSCRGLSTLRKDLSRYGDLMTGNNDLDDGKFFDVKKEIYRLTDRVFAALAKCYEVDESGTFAILRKLCERGIILSQARDNFASASAIAIKLRLRTYLKAGRQGEQVMASSNEQKGKLTFDYCMPNDEELFHFFFIAIPLYKELQKLTAARNIPSSLTHSSLFFDVSDATMGHIYCRLLKYDKARDCYDRTLKKDPENLSIGIRRISIALCITKDTEKMDKIRQDLDTLLCRIDQSWSEPDQEATPFVNRLDLDEIRQLVEVLPLARSFFGCPKYFELAKNIMMIKAIRGAAPVIKMRFMKYLHEVFDEQHIIDNLTSQMTDLIGEEDVSTKSILCLIGFGEFLFRQYKFNDTYRCFQRALSMGHILYGTKPNLNMMTSLYFLGLTSSYLFKNRESKFFFEWLVKEFESFGGATGRLMVKSAYLELALLSVEIGYSAKESRCYLEKGLNATTGSRNDAELKLDCFLYFNLATTCHAQHNQEEAWKFALDGKACLGEIVGVQDRVIVTSLLVDTLAEIQKANEGIIILEEEVLELTSQSQTEEKALCLMSLGKLCVLEGLASDAENYYKQAVDMQDNEDNFDTLECLIGISEAVMMDDKRVSEATKVLDKAFILAEKLPTSLTKYCLVDEMGKLCENHGYISRARECFDEALRTYKEVSNVAKKPLLIEFVLLRKLAKLAKDVCAIVSVDPGIAMQAQRSNYDRAAEALRQHVATGQVDSSTVNMFLLLALDYKSVNESEATRLLLETLKISEIVYGTNESNEMIARILRQLSESYRMARAGQDAIKYKERLIKMEMDLYLSNPFNEYISQNLIWLALLSFLYPVSIDTVERAYEFLLSAQKDKAPTNNTAKTAAARCFTSLGILFCTSLGDLKKVKTSIEIASQLFSEIPGSVEGDKPYSVQTICNIMKEILQSETTVTLDVVKLADSIREAIVATLTEDSKTSENCSNGRENVELPIPSSDGVKSREIDSSDANAVDLPTQTVSQLKLPVELESFPDASLNTESSNLDEKRLLLRVYSDALEYSRKKGNVHQAVKIYTSLHELSFYESCPFDTVKKLISDAIRAKEDNRLSSGIGSLDIAVQLSSNWRQKAKILKLRGECYLSRGDFRTAAINFNEAAAIYSSKTVENRDDLCEYSEVLIGLIKSEMLCQNVAGAWLKYQEVIKLVSDHEHRESIHLQEIKLLYLGAKCLDILSQSAESKDDKLAQARSLCEQALLILSQTTNATNASEPVEEVGSSGRGNFFALKCEVQLLLAAIFLKLHQEEKADKILEEMEKYLINIRGEFCNISTTLCEPEFLKICSWIGRVLVMREEMERSSTPLNWSISLFFSAALPDMLSFYEEFLPLLQAITVTKSSGTSHESRSPFQQAVDMCKVVSVKHGNDLNNVYKFLETLANIYMSLGRTEEAIVVAEIGLEICDLMGNNNVTDRINNRGRMLLYLAQMHQLNSTNSAFDRNKELNLAERYYLTDRGSAAEFVLEKNLSYANFLCEQKRFAEADAVLQDLGNELSDKFVYCAYFSRVFYGPGIQKSVEVDGELLSTVEHCMYSTMVRVFVEMGKKREAVAACEKLTANPVVVHDAIHAKRPSSIPYLIEACHRELLSLLSDEDQKQLQNCEFPLSPANIFKLYYMLNEYTFALTYYTNETESADLIEMKISCLHLAGSELVEMDRGRKSLSYFKQFFAMLHTKEGFLDKPFHAQCATLAGYSFANRYYIFLSLGEIMDFERGNLDGGIQCYERCLELDEDLTLDQSLVATLAWLYQSKALTVDIENQDSCERQMNLALDLFQKLLQKTAELKPFVEWSFGSLLLKLERYPEAVERFENVIKRADFSAMEYTDVDKPLFDVYLRREIEARGSITIRVKVQAF